MDSLFDWLADGNGEEVGRTMGDETLLEALFGEIASVLAASSTRPAAVVGGCQADKGGMDSGAIEKLVASVSAACHLACGEGCGQPPRFDADGVETVVDPLLHQISPGPVLVVADRRAAFGFVLVARKLDTCASPWRSATHEVVWSFSPAAAAGAVERLGRHAAEAVGTDPLPRALDRAAARPRPKGGAKPGTGSIARGPRGESAAWRELELAMAGQMLGVLQQASTFETSLAALASTLASVETLDEMLEQTARSVGVALDASRAVAVVDRTLPPDEAPTNQLDIAMLEGEVHQGVYTRADTRRLSKQKAQAGGDVVSRLVVPIARDEKVIGELRLVDTRASRVWTAMERRMAGRAAAITATTLLRPLGGARETPPGRTDPLTGFEPRAEFERRVAETIVDAQATGRPVSLVRLDIDGIDTVSESHGHTAGDALVRHVAAILEDQVARDEESALASMGGGGFAILLPGFTHVAAARVAEVLLDAISGSEAPFASEITPRAGAATFPDAASTAEQLITAARPSHGDER